MKKFIKNIFAKNKNNEFYENEYHEVFDFLKKNNPNIKVPESFKNSLKLKLEGISFIKYENKSFELKYILIPIFSLIFAVFGFFSFYKTIDFNQDNTMKFETKFIGEEAIQSKTVIVEVPSDNISIKKQNLIEVKKIISLKKANITKPEFTKNSNTNIAPRKIDLAINEDLKKEIKSDVEEKNLVNNQIIEILGNDENENNIEDDSVYGLDGNSDFSEDGGTEMETQFYDNGDAITEYVNTFEEYCLEYNSQIIIKYEEKSCIIEGKICLKSNYKNNSCTFIKKK